VGHCLYNKDPQTNNGKVIGKFKDECEGKRILEFCGLKPKLYALIHEEADKVEKGEDDDTDEEKNEEPSKPQCKRRAKGVSTSVSKKLCFDDYKSVLFDQSTIKKEMHSIRSFKHELYTIATTKVAQNAFCNKRYWHDDGVYAYAYGHKNIKQE
jgi:hypothetical protein